LVCNSSRPGNLLWESYGLTTASKSPRFSVRATAVIDSPPLVSLRSSPIFSFLFSSTLRSSIVASLLSSTLRVLQIKSLSPSCTSKASLGSCCSKKYCFQHQMLQQNSVICFRDAIKPLSSPLLYRREIETIVCNF
jgi:hypothetical protein